MLFAMPNLNPIAGWKIGSSISEHIWLRIAACYIHMCLSINEAYRLWEAYVRLHWICVYISSWQVLTAVSFGSQRMQALAQAAAVVFRQRRWLAGCQHWGCFKTSDCCSVGLSPFGAVGVWSTGMPYGVTYPRQPVTEEKVRTDRLPPMS